MIIGDFLRHWPIVRGIMDAVGAMLALCTAPLILELLVLTFASQLRRRCLVRGKGGPGLKLTCIVPAHNEEKLIARCVKSLTASMPPECEVLVVAHRCTDRTAESAREAGARVLDLEGEAHTGKGGALEFGFQKALAHGAEAIVVVDADSVAAPGFLHAVQASLDQGAEALQCCYTMRPSGQADHRTRLAGLAFQGFNVIRPRGRARLGLSSGIFGNGFAMRAEVLERVPYQAKSVVEDLEYHLALLNAGVRVRFLEETAVWSEMPVAVAGSATQRARWEGGRLRMARLHSQRLLLGLLRGKLELAEPLLDILALPLAQATALILLLLCLPVPTFRWYAVCACAVIGLHVLAAAAESGDTWLIVRALAFLPKYIVWKVALVPRTWIAARANADWIRTSRAETVNGFSEESRPSTDMRKVEPSTELAR